MRKAPPNDPRKILIVRLSAIGDVVRTLPALRALRQRFPSAYIAWAVEDASSDLLSGHPDLDRVFIFRRGRWKRDIRRLHTFFNPAAEVARLLREIRSERFDLALDFHGILKSGLVSALSGAPFRAGLGRRYCKEANHLFNNYHVDVRSSAISRVVRNLRFISFLGISETGRYDPVIPVTDDDRAAIDRFLKERDLAAAVPLVAIHPGTSRKTLYKRWNPSGYAILADRLIGRLGARVIWTWGPGELETVQEIVGKMRHDSVIAERFSLRQLAELFRRAALFVGSDSGPMHIACFVKTPSVVIYGPTDPVVNAPYRHSRFIVLRKDVSCNPCRIRDCSRVDCMNAISPEEVFNAAAELLSGPKAYPAAVGQQVSQ
ncbi:MAG: rfaC 2 [Deltaproteobacteria bacterium]|nr:rfaC 2 [Deltaproteobacteria bacterium]